MYNTSQVYELSFISPGRRPYTRPRFVFTIKTEHLEEIVHRLRIMSADQREHADSYCAPNTVFTHLTPDLFGRMEFGYGRCGYVAVAGDEMHLNVELCGGERLY